MTRSEKIERVAPLPSPNEPSTRAMRDWIGRQLSGEALADLPAIEVGASFPEGAKPAAERAAQITAAKAAESEAHTMFENDYESENDEQTTTTAVDETDDSTEWVKMSDEEQAAFDALGLSDDKIAEFEAMSAEDQQKVIDYALSQFTDEQRHAANDGTPEGLWARSQVTQESWNAKIAADKAAGKRW